MTEQTDIAIRVQNLSKAYKLYNKHVDRMKESLHPLRKKYHHDFYALNDVSFEVKKGETVGIIGKNGSGKSTLLKIITGVLTPTSGFAQVNGKVSALLELGAGFNPEFSGVENVYFQGAIMGYTKAQMEEKIDDILSFADIGEYVYQPVKTYSSGMFARLAFAVAINVDPEILIVDEALAVGDARFVKRCYEKMDIFRSSGRTILLVSHDVNTIKSFTTRTLLLDTGVLLFDGDPLESAIRYMRLLFPNEYNSNENSNSIGQIQTEEAALLKKNEFCLKVLSDKDDYCWGIGGGEITCVNIYGVTNPNIIRGGENLSIEMLFEWDPEFIKNKIVTNQVFPNIIIGFGLRNKKNIDIFACNTYEMGYKIDPYESSKGVVVFNTKLPNLAPDEYFIYTAIAIGNQENHVQLKWNEVLIQLNCITNRKYVFGLLYPEVTLMIGKSETRAN